MSLDKSQRTDVRKGCTACGQEFPAEMTVCPDDGMILAPIISEELVGTVLENKYEILEKIGAGGMGAVYKARHQLMHRMVAIKVVLAQLSANSATLKRFAQEARATSQLNHPNILTVFDFGISPAGQPYLVMDFVEGVNFAKVLEELGRVPYQRAIRIFLQVCAALGHAHQRGIVHRDMKPSNIMLTELDGEPDFVKVLDFGIAKVLSSVDGETDNLTRTGEIFGSPLYMSPEQFRGRSLDARSDIYALGCVMYRTVTGTCPVTGKDVLECMYKHVNENVAPFEQVCPELELPERLEAIIMKALAKEPDDRFATMSELRAELEGLCEELKLGPMSPVYMRSGVYQSDAAVPISSGSFSAVDQPTPQLGLTGAHAEIDKTMPPKQAQANRENNGEKGTPSRPSQLERTSHSGLPSVSPPPARAELPPGAVRPPASNARMLTIVVGVVAVSIALIGGFAFLNRTQEVKKPPPAAGTFEDFTSRGLDAYDKGNYAQAEAYLKKALALAEREPETPHVVAALINLGEAEVANDNMKPAKELLLSAATKLKQSGREKTPEFSRVQQDLGELVVAQDDYDAAEPYFQKALELRMSFKGKDRADAADSLQGLATILVKRGQYSKAVEKLLEAKRIIEQDVGAKNKDYILIIADLARVDSMMGADAKSKDVQKKMFAESKKLYEEAVTLAEKQFGPTHPQLGKIILAYATLCFLEHDFTEAEARFTQALVIARKNSGEESMAVAEIKAPLAILLMEQKRYGEAEAYLDEALKTARKNLPPSSNIVQRWQAYKKMAERGRRR